MGIENDPRVYFAAERTLLAWLRTGMSVIGLGFVVSRFGLFMRIMVGESLPVAWRWESTVIGVTLVGLGSMAVAMAAWQHLRFCHTLAETERPRKYWMSLVVWFSVALAVLGGLLAIYVAATPTIPIDPMPI